MVPKIRTEVRTLDWKQCQQCGAQTYLYEMQRRKCRTGETTFYLWRLIPLHSWGHSTPQDICPTCVSQEEAHDRWRKLRLGLLFGVGLLLFTGWTLTQILYFAATAGVGFFTVRSGVRYIRRRRRALIIR